MMLSDVCLSDVWRLSVTYIGPKSRTERPGKTKIGREAAHVTRDSDSTFQGQKVKGQGHQTALLTTVLTCQTADSCSGERGNVLAVGNYCYVAVCLAARGASAPTEGGEGWGIS